MITFGKLFNDDVLAENTVRNEHAVGDDGKLRVVIDVKEDLNPYVKTSSFTKEELAKFEDHQHNVVYGYNEVATRLAKREFNNNKNVDRITFNAPYGSDGESRYTVDILRKDKKIRSKLESTNLAISVSELNKLRDMLSADVDDIEDEE